MNEYKLLLAKIYKRGTEASFLILLIGLLELLIFHHQPKPSSLNIINLISQSFQLNPYSTLYLGLIILISTPISVLILILAISIIKKSYKEVVLALTIILIIVLAVLLGIR